MAAEDIYVHPEYIRDPETLKRFLDSEKMAGFSLSKLISRTGIFSESSNESHAVSPFTGAIDPNFRLT